MTKKSAAQLKRLMKRAEARGEVYIPPVESIASSVPPGSTKDSPATTIDDDRNATSTTMALHNSDSRDNNDIDKSLYKKRVKAARILRTELDRIEKDEDLKAKERRSAKRKAEAIAIESSGMSTAQELLDWFSTLTDQDPPNKIASRDKKTAPKSGIEDKKRSNPYIVFVGQLSFDTTKEELFAHIKKQLESDNNYKITENHIKIRMLHDVKTNKSRGMAFVEVIPADTNKKDSDDTNDDAELLYALLKLHHSYLKGRRINVERTTGGGNDTRKAKIQQFRQEQIQFMATTVQNMLQEYYDRGEIQKEGEIDDGVIQLCQRHSATVVQAALERYVESNGRDMDNPSAYLTFLLGKLAEEGIYNDRDKDKKSTQQQNNKKRIPAAKRTSASAHTTTNQKSDSGAANVNNKQKRHNDVSGVPSNKRHKHDRDSSVNSSFAQQGVDMNPIPKGSNDLLQIFPSLSRGRGRGRGYM